jgi:hypothetical protein
MKKNETLEGLMKQSGFNEADLLENAEMMGLKANHEWGALKKTELRKRVASEVLNHPKKVLSCLPIEDLRLLQILKDAQPGMGVKMYQTTQMMSMAMLGLAEQVETDDGEFDTVSITEDFKKAIRPYVDEVLDAFEVKFRVYVEQIAIGALNLYGVLTVSELKTILKDCMELEDDGTGVFEHIYPQSVALQMQKNEGYFGDGEDFFTSPFVHDFGYVLQERKKRKETATLKPFDVDDIKEAGGMPVPGIPNEVSERMLNILETKLGFTKQEAYYWEFMLWRLVQEEDTQIPAIIQTLMDAVSPENCPKGLNDLNDIIQVVMEFLNHAPRWIFRGRCPVDLRQSDPPMTSAPQITIGPNMRRMGYRQEDVQRQVNDIWKQERESFMPYVAPPKVGRNDPCPCGSGKKYKNCCGRGN